MSAAIGVDIGGTKIAIGLLQDRKFTHKKTLATPKDGWRNVLDSVVIEIQAIKKDHPDVQHIGVGMPGMFNKDQTEVAYAANVHGFRNVPLVDYMSQALGRKVVLENDANAAALAEDALGAAQQASSSIFVTISTGIGSSVIINGRVWRGFHGIAGEIGHTIAMPDGPLAPSGIPGALEAIASGTAIAHSATFAFGRSMTTAEVFTLAQEGDKQAELVVHKAMRYLGMALANAQKMIDPELFVVGGGVASVGSYFFTHVQRYAQEFVHGFSDITIVPAQLGTDAGAIGAAIAALQVK